MSVERTAQAGPVKVDLSQYQEWENTIAASDLAAIVARWKFGHALVQERNAHGKQLPNGRRDEVCEAVHRSRAEIDFRMQFADLVSESEVSNVFDSFPSWRDIVQLYLPKRFTDADDNVIMPHKTGERLSPSQIRALRDAKDESEVRGRAARPLAGPEPQPAGEPVSEPAAEPEVETETIGSGAGGATTPPAPTTDTTTSADVPTNGAVRLKSGIEMKSVAADAERAAEAAFEAAEATKEEDKPQAGPALRTLHDQLAAARVMADIIVKLGTEQFRTIREGIITEQKNAADLARVLKKKVDETASKKNDTSDR
jgi:hypothetical protein